MLKDVPFVAAGDNVEATVFSVCWVNSRPRSDSCFGIKPRTEVEFVLMPRETETDLGCLPDKQIIDGGCPDRRCQQVDR